MKLAIGLASGMGNAVFMLPAIKALKLLGHHIAICSETDFDTSPLWRRNQYVDEVLTPPYNLEGYECMCGQWRPATWRIVHSMTRFTVPNLYDCEWRSDFRLAEHFGWQGEAPDVSDWCRDLDRSKRWDVGIIPGSKHGVWLRKRWPGMKDVADYFIQQGLKVAVFGLYRDDVDSIPGEKVDTGDISTLPDALAGCRVIISTDSGAGHVAGSLGIPVVMIYTATSEKKGDPVCQPSRKIITPLSLACRPCNSKPVWKQCEDWKCREIRIAEVIEAAQTFLERKDVAA